MTPTLLLILKLSVGVISLAIGMGSTLGDVTYLLRRPGRMFRSVLAMYVLVPLTALVLVKTLTLAAGVEIAFATRHIGIAVLVAASVPGSRTAVLVAAYIVTAAVVSIPYLRWRRSRSVATVSP